MYADDVVFYTSSADIKVAEETLQSHATRVFNWFSQSGLVIHTGKTKIELFNPPTLCPNPPNILMGDTRLECCTSYEYLGIILDDCITFKTTISKNVSSASNRCYMLGSMRRRMSLNTAVLVYKQTIMPVLEYCGYLFNGVIQTQHKRLQMVQNRGLRISLNVQRLYHITDLHTDADIDYLGVRFDYAALTAYT